MQTASHAPPAPHRGPPKHTHRLPTAKPAARRVTIAFDAFPELPFTPHTKDATNADYWEAKAREAITHLSAALVLHKQLTSGVTVPRTLTYVLNAGQREIDSRIKTAINRHAVNGGKREAELLQAWKAAA